MIELKKIIKKVIEDIYRDYFIFKQKQSTLLFRKEEGLQCEIYRRLKSNKVFNKKYHIYPEEKVDSGKKMDLVIFEPKHGWYDTGMRYGKFKEAGVKKADAIIELKSNRKGHDQLKNEILRDVAYLKKESCPLKMVVIFDPNCQLSKKEIKDLFKGTNILYFYVDLTTKEKIINF